MFLVRSQSLYQIVRRISIEKKFLKIKDYSKCFFIQLFEFKVKTPCCSKSEAGLD